jgi:hypothetical protein
LIAMDIESIINKTDEEEKHVSFFAKIFSNIKKSSRSNVWKN